MTSVAENSDLLRREYGSSEEAEFTLAVHDVKATDLLSRNRFRDKLKLHIELDGGQKDKSSKQVISGAGEVKWKGPYKFDYKIWSYKHLGEKLILIRVMKSKTEEIGRLSIDLWTVATGPKEHNLPINDLEGKPIGRLNFMIDMEEVSNVAVLFKEIKLKNLKPPSSSNGECHPYLKYAYSKNWPVMDDGKKYAVYSTVQYNTKNPEWYDLPEVRFKASLRELLQESIVLHVTHSGSVLNTTLGRCNLLFRTLVDNGKTFKESDLISFRGPLKIDNAEIMGVLIFRYLPRTAQMKNSSAIKKAIHTEKGIHDAIPLLPHLPIPRLTVIRSDEKAVDLSQAGGDSPSMQKKRAATFGPKAVFKDGPSGRNRPPQDVLHSPELGKSFPKAKELEDKGGKPRTPKFVDDLISLDTPPLQRRNAPTAFPAALLGGTAPSDDPFVVSSNSGSYAPSLLGGVHMNPPVHNPFLANPSSQPAPTSPNSANPFEQTVYNVPTGQPFQQQAYVQNNGQPFGQSASFPAAHQHGNGQAFGQSASFPATAANPGFPPPGVLSPEQIQHQQHQLLQQQQALQQQMAALKMQQEAVSRQQNQSQNPFQF